MFNKGYVLFSGKDCPKCLELKAILSQDGVDYEEFDIWNNSDALRYIMNKGFRSIPQLFKDGEKVDYGK